MDTEIREIQVASFRLADELYAIDIMRIREIIRPQKLARLVKAPSFVEGVINLRGVVIPVVDLRKRFGLPHREVDHRTKLLIVVVGGHLLGLVVDEVTEVLTVSVSEIKPPPQVLKGVGADYLIGVCLVKESMISLLDIDRILTNEEEAALDRLESVSIQDVTKGEA